jgi:hypothetical protein
MVAVQTSRQASVALSMETLFLSIRFLDYFYFCLLLAVQDYPEFSCRFFKIMNSSTPSISNVLLVFFQIAVTHRLLFS